MAKKELIYGVHPVVEALKGEARDLIEIHVARGRRSTTIESIVRRTESLGLRVKSVSQDALAKSTGTEHHQGIAALVKGYEYADEDDILDLCAQTERAPLIVLLDCIQDPHNLGAILRSAHAMGADAAILPKDRAVGITPTVRKTAAGATAHIPIAQVTNLARTIRRLHNEAGLWIMGLDHRAKPTLMQQNLTLPLGIVVGSEGKGLRPTVAKACHLMGRIPLLGEVSSLNASVATSIALYETVRQRAEEQS